MAGANQQQVQAATVDQPPRLVKRAFLSDPANAQTYTFTDVDIGEAAPDRLVVVCVTSTEAGVNRTVSSGTIAAAAATLVAAVSAASFIPTAILSRNVATGTTADITVTFSGAVTNCGIKIYVLYGLRSLTPVDAAETSATTGASRSISLATKADGIAIFACSKGNGGDTTFSSATRDEHQIVESRRHATASIAPTAEAASTTETASFTNSSNGIGLVAASWR